MARDADAEPSPKHLWSASPKCLGNSAINAGVKLQLAVAAAGAGVRVFNDPRFASPKKSCGEYPRWLDNYCCTRRIAVVVTGRQVDFDRRRQP